MLHFTDVPCLSSLLQQCLFTGWPLPVSSCAIHWPFEMHSLIDETSPLAVFAVFTHDHYPHLIASFGVSLGLPVHLLCRRCCRHNAGLGFGLISMSQTSLVFFICWSCFSSWPISVSLVISSCCAHAVCCSNVFNRLSLQACGKCHVHSILIHSLSPPGAGLRGSHASLQVCRDYDWPHMLLR